MALQLLERFLKQQLYEANLLVTVGHVTEWILFQCSICQCFGVCEKSARSVYICAVAYYHQELTTERTVLGNSSQASLVRTPHEVRQLPGTY